jgi:hypothetical protein
MNKHTGIQISYYTYIVYTKSLEFNKSSEINFEHQDKFGIRLYVEIG